VELDFPVKYQSKGLTFIYNQKGRISLLKTLLKNNLLRLLKEIIQLPVHQYDLVINDFECVSAWSCKLKGKTCLAMGHQAAFLKKTTPRPKRQSWLGEFILKYYAPSNKAIGFHFDKYSANTFTPVIRKEIREMDPVTGEHFTVYLPAYGLEEQIKWLSQFTNTHWELFSKEVQTPQQIGKILARPIHAQAFAESLRTCQGILTSAGFESPAEALYLGKKLLVIPIAGQYEQLCNAAALQRMGVPVAQTLNSRSCRLIGRWIYSENKVAKAFPYILPQIIENLLVQEFSALKPPHLHTKTSLLSVNSNS
jgi:uncharacterized protein (TIGR00661 family)